MVLRRNRDKAGSTRKLNFKMIINGFRSKTGKSENKEELMEIKNVINKINV